MSGAWTGRRFAILMPWGRVGSNLVVGVFNEAAGVPLLNEPTTRIRGTAAAVGPFAADREQLDFLAAFPAPADFVNGDPAVGVAGVKLTHTSFLSPMGAYEALAAGGYRIAAMDRRDHLRAAVSQLRAEQRRADKGGRRGAWAVKAGERKPGPTALDPALLLHRAGAFEIRSRAMHDYLAALIPAERVIHVEYADLSADPEGTIRGIADHVGVALPDRFALPHRKATSDDLREDVLNYDEVRAAAAGTPFERFLDD
ncbi:sulfotransferase [Jannaschia sp. W003]|uniref:sulfotransferase n=1 Tax=Jannaschia sp. W003 TaxID=2867012 RepID=UPI0021A3E75E|nr:sulfotransferase [Jannaschia sp. W003]UWQ21517.1 sulfotransferase [Jannaschia sp. W003]